MFPPGPGSGAAIPITSATTIVASITRVTMQDDGKALVELYLRDENNFSLKGLPAANIRFVLARLEPAANGASSTWHAITRRTEAFPGTPAPTPADKVTGTGPTNQAYTETATAGVWTDKQNGVYTYTFAKSLQGDAEIPFDGSLPHRVGLEIRLTPAIPSNNAIYTFTPATNQPVNESGREIVDNDTCNACHDNLSFHGGARFDLQYCAMCHESYSFDAQSGNSIDLKVMIHKIHSGETLPSVEAGGFYGIFGFGNTFTDFSDDRLPAGQAQLHDLPRGKRHRHAAGEQLAPNREHGDLQLVPRQRQFRHRCEPRWRRRDGRHLHVVPRSERRGGQPERRERAHVIPENEAAKRFKFEVVKVQAIKLDGSPGDTACAATTTACKVLPGEFPLVTIKVSDPATGTPYKLSDPAFTNVIPCTPRAAGHDLQSDDGAPACACRVHDDQLHQPGAAAPRRRSRSRSTILATAAAPAGSPAAAGGAPTLNADGSYSKAGAKPLPSGLIGGSGASFLEGRTIVDVSATSTPEYAEVGVTSSAGVVFPITDGTPVALARSWTCQRCDDCHQSLSFHGDNRNDNTDLCATCHNPENAAGADAGRRPAVGLQAHDPRHPLGATYDFGGLSFASVRYPGKINNCEGCHKPDTYYPVDPAKVFATSITRGANAASPVDDIAYTPNAAICGVVPHHRAGEAAHRELNGGSFTATKNANGTSNEAACRNVRQLSRSRQVGRREGHARRRPVPVKQLTRNPNEDGRTDMKLTQAFPRGLLLIGLGSGIRARVRRGAGEGAERRRAVQREGCRLLPHVPRRPGSRSTSSTPRTRNRTTRARRSARAACSARRVTVQAAITRSASRRANRGRR